MAAHDHIQDIMRAKLKAHYGGNHSLNDYLAMFLKDNPTFKTLLGNPAFYSKTSSEHQSDAAARFWQAYNP